MLPPPENFQTHPKNLDPSRRNPNNPRKISTSQTCISQSPPPPENISTPKKYVNTYPSPHPFSSFYLFFFIFQKKYENSGWGVKPPEIRPCVLSIDQFHFVRYCFLNNALSLYGSYDCT